MAFVNPLADIFAVSAFLVIVGKVLQNKLMDKEGMDHSKKEMNKKKEKMSELLKKKDEKSLKEAQKIQTEMLEMSSEMMRGSMRYMMFSLPLFLIVFYFLGFFYGSETINLPIPLPWWFDASVWNPFTWVNVKFYGQTNWLGWYFASYLFISIVIGLGKRIIKITKGGK